MLTNFDLSGKTILVTGGSSGVGKSSCFQLATLNANLIIAGRNKEKTEAVIEEIKAKTGNKNVEFLLLKLDDLNQVKEAATEFLNKKVKLDVLMNNAGIAGSDGFSKDGYEVVFATNHLGPFLFTQLLLPAIKDGGRIVFVSSRAAGSGEKYDFNKLKESGGRLQPYANSYQLPDLRKLANACYSKKLSQILAPRKIKTYALHPGVVATDVWRELPSFLTSFIKLFMISEEQGSITQVYCSISPELENETGKFYDECKPIDINKITEDQAYLDELYTKSLELVKTFL